MKQHQKVIIFSHRVDNDGYLSATIMNNYFKYYVEKCYPETLSVEIKHVPWTYGDKIPDINLIKKYDWCLVLDLHFENEMTIALRQHFQNKFIWIEHHALPILEFKEYCKANHIDDFVNGIQSTKIQDNNSYSNSAAELCWYFLFGCEGTDRFERYTGHIQSANIFEKDKFKLPYLIKLVSDYDVWNYPNSNEWQYEIYPFQMGTKMIISSWKDMNKLYQDVIIGTPECDNIIKQIINKGQTIIEYETSECKKDIRTGMIEREFEFKDKIYKACILNTTKRSSNVFNNMPNRDDYDVFICFNVIENDENELQYRYSMYAFKDDVNCAGMIINGLKFNGHNHATGAQSNKFIF